MDALTQAVDTCPTGFLRIDQSGIIRETNKTTATMFGYLKEDLIGLPVEVLLPSTYHSIHREHVQTTSGRECWVHAIGRPIIENGKVTSLEGTFQDIDQRKRTEQKLLQANEELAQFAYRTSHDLKSPISSIKNLGGFILDDLADGDFAEIKANTERIIKQSTKLESFITTILNLAKADLSEERYQWANLKEVLTEIQERYEYELEDKQVTLVWSQLSIENIYIQKYRLVQVLENLVSNGIKYHHLHEGERFVEVSGGHNHASEGIDIIIKDNGQGIPEEFLGQVFNLFTRFHPTCAEGSGLGLSIVKKHVEAMNGRIEISSSDSGTSFHLSLPCKGESME